MGIRHAILAAAIVVCAVLPARAQQLGRTAPAADARQLEEPSRQLAETLIPLQAAKDQAVDLNLLFRLQLAARRYHDAEETIRRLQALYRTDQIVRARALTPWLIFARSQQLVDEGQVPDAALERAFGEVYADVSDKEAVELTPWFVYDLERARTTLADAEKACGETPLSTCPTGADVVRAQVALRAWEFMLPRAAGLVRADLERRFIIDEDLLVPTPEGAQIAALIIRPRTAGPQTALLNFTIYARDDWSFADAARMAGHGYAGVVAYTRGKGRSPGSATPYLHDGEDAAAVIAWLAAQPWSDGRVGMFSGSYNASTQWAAAKRMPPALKAMATNASNAPGIDTPMEGNVFLNFMYPWPLYTTNTKGLDEETYNDPQRWAALDRAWYASGRPYRDLPLIDGTPNPVFSEWISHPDYDAYWQRLLPYREEFARIDIPVFVQTGYFDGGMVGALYYLRQHLRYRPDADHRLLIGPYHHVAMQQGVLNVVDGYEIDAAARIDLQDIRMRWFDHVFRGAPLPEILSDRINFQVMGANIWRHAPSLEAMGDDRLRLYLSDARDDGRFALAARPPAQAGFTELTVDFADRSDADYQVPSVLGRDIDVRNALVFATEPFANEIEVNGAFSGRLNTTVNKKDLDLLIALYELRPDGTYFPLTTFLGRASYLRDRSRRELLRPGRTESLAFESERITARRIAAGSRIVAVVGVSKTPDVQINYGSGKDVSDESIADAGEPMRVRWANDSYLELTIIADPAL